MKVFEKAESSKIRTKGGNFIDFKIHVNFELHTRHELCVWMKHSNRLSLGEGRIDFIEG